MSDTQIKTLEDFKDEVAKEYGYSNTSSFASQSEYISYMTEARRRFHAYQLECKNKENENLKRQIRGLELLNQYTTAECAEKIKDIKELKRRIISDGELFEQEKQKVVSVYDNLISEKIKEMEELNKEVERLHLALNIKIG